MSNDFSREAELGFRAFGLCSDAKALSELTRHYRDYAVGIASDLREARTYLDQMIEQIKELEHAY